MRITTCSSALAVCLFLLLGGCHAQKNFTQTFVNENDPHQSLKLASSVGFIRPAAEFPRNILFRLFGTDELTGTYVLTTDTETVQGKFVAGKDGDETWIKLTSEGKKDWSLKAQTGGLLVASDDTVWRLKDSFTDAEAAAVIKIGR
jgi:hypothetical protein